MQESVTYQAIVEEGEVKGVRETLLRQGRLRFGEPGPANEAMLAVITDLERLLRMAEEILRVNSWKELLATP